MSDNLPIGYTVAAEFEDPGVADEWLCWLVEEHIAEVLAGGATAAEVIDLEAAVRSFEVRYRFPSGEAWERYEREAAPRLRAEGLRRFPVEKGIRYRRSIGVIRAAMLAKPS
jgi:hypothetical protein